jgi:hypothetical protein
MDDDLAKWAVKGTYITKMD